MEYPFTADEWEDLMQSERAHRCRLLGDEALRLAERAIPLDLKATHLKLARQWRDLAGEIEKAVDIAARKARGGSAE